MYGVEKQVKDRVLGRKRGAVLFPDDFEICGSSEAVRLALHRLEKEGFIRRLAHGIYYRPIIDDLIGELRPSVEEVAQSIAKRDKIRLMPTGAYALNALGLSTQVPMKLVFLTDGAPRIIQVGKVTIKLKKTTPKVLSAKGKISSLVIQALKEIGKDKIYDEEEVKILGLLKKEDPKHLIHDISLAPVWIQKIMKKALN
ncbi:hypothetical protein BZG02_10805 [Labilibaculum filiforme]|uniref:Transcriptional regulator, AbiEi antitoxin, Type IV TA system n=2 Tax=Labilibaculum filiforme TaxID=1940526 RepID=A0A2N3HYT3_9BACT|nr:hypothetical protein BZG02_10805 [Labilibaculum filiforme]